jgi:F-type H+-transporting ATPase subunit b
VLIDWFTVGAQVINFLILVWLLKRFFYRPILDALDAREKRIASDLAAAAAKECEAETERSRFEQKNEELDRCRNALLADARDEARAERKRLLATAHADADELRRRRNEAQRREFQALCNTIEQRTCAEVFAIARKVLGDLAGTTLEAHMAEAFIGRVRNLSSEEKARLVAAMGISPAEWSQYPPSGEGSPRVPAPGAGGAIAKHGEGAILVRSAFEFPMAQQEAIAAAIRQTLGGEMALRFQLEPDLISGVELVANGYKAAWSIGGYLASLEEEVGNLLDAGSEDESAAALDDHPSTGAGFSSDGRNERDDGESGRPDDEMGERRTTGGSTASRERQIDT